jgi:hypothetical protein
MRRPASRVAPPPSRTRRRLALPRHRSTTAQMCAIYPGVVQAPLPQVGPLLGVDLSAGHGPLCWDPFEAYNHQLVTNPSAFVMGEPGSGKSSLIKCWAAWQHALYGRSRWLTISDPKGEYRPLAERIGMSVIRLEPGGDTRLNPLESHTRFGSSADARERTQDRIVQATMLYSLAGTQLQRRPTPLERKVLRTVVDILGDHTTGPPAMLSDVLHLLAAPTEAMCTATARTGDELVRDVEEVRFGLDELCTGPLRGMFDGPSNVEVDWHGAGLVMDLSGVIDDERAMALAMVAAVSWSRQQRRRLGDRQRINQNDESYYMYRLAETVEFAQERRKLGRAYGEANIDICHRPSDLSSQADDGSKVAKMATGLIADSSMKVIFRQAPSELAAAADMFNLSTTEVACISTAVRGRALWKIGDRSLIGQHHLPPALHGLTDTDGFMRRDSLLADGWAAA